MTDFAVVYRHEYNECLVHTPQTVSRYSVTYRYVDVTGIAIVDANGLLIEWRCLVDRDRNHGRSATSGRINIVAMSDEMQLNQAGALIQLSQREMVQG